MDTRRERRTISELMQAQDKPTLRAPKLSIKEQLAVDKHLKDFLEDARKSLY